MMFKLAAMSVRDEGLFSRFGSQSDSCSRCGVVVGDFVVLVVWGFFWGGWDHCYIHTNLSLSRCVGTRTPTDVAGCETVHQA